MKVSMIYCRNQNKAIGNKGHLLYHIPEDLKRFKKLTTGHTVVMGRKSFESLPDGPLPNRRNIVLSKTLDNIAGVEVFSSLEDALKVCEGEDEVFIIGGTEVYRQALPYTNNIYETFVYETGETPEADTFLPEEIVESLKKPLWWTIQVPEMFETHVNGKNALVVFFKYSKTPKK